MKSLLACALILSSTLGAQNVGIGTTSPTGPLSFASTLGNKIVLWGDGNSNHYGVGVQGGLLQFYADAPAANIAFGYGKSNAFTERMRILNGGNYDGMILNGRLLIRNGSNDTVGGGGGVWLYKADNSAFLGFMGTQNNQNIGFYGGPAGWGFTYDAINSRVGIGNNNPNAPLAFGAVGGKKITLYPGTLGDAGFGIAPNRLQIFSDNPNADVAIGYDAAGVFNERFAFKPNGALALQGNTGQSGQVLRSNGSAAPAWTNLPGVITQESGNSSLVLTGFNFFELPNSTLVLNLPRAAKVLVFMQLAIIKPQCLIGSCASKARVVMSLNGTSITSETINGINFSTEVIQSFSTASYGPEIFELSAGTHTLSFKAVNVFNEPQFSFSASALIFEKW